MRHLYNLFLRTLLPSRSNTFPNSGVCMGETFPMERFEPLVLFRLTGGGMDYTESITSFDVPRGSHRMDLDRHHPGRSNFLVIRSPVEGFGLRFQCWSIIDDMRQGHAPACMREFKLFLIRTPPQAIQRLPPTFALPHFCAVLNTYSPTSNLSH